jgi:hypothetical protein
VLSKPAKESIPLGGRLVQQLNQIGMMSLPEHYKLATMFVALVHLLDEGRGALDGDHIVLGAMDAEDRYIDSGDVTNWVNLGEIVSVVSNKSLDCTTQGPTPTGPNVKRTTERHKCRYRLHVRLGHESVAPKEQQGGKMCPGRLADDYRASTPVALPCQLNSQC